MILRHRAGAIFCTLAAVLALPGCHSVDIDDDVVYGRVYVPFTTAGDWEMYGVSGAMQSRRFILWDRVPANYPYQDYCFTGFGGVLLACTAHSDYVAYDLACPVEHSQKVTVAIDPETNFAVCPKCRSVYDVFQLQEAPGYPVSGPARTEGFALTRYRLVFNADNRYALITN